MSQPRLTLPHAHHLGYVVHNAAAAAQRYEALGYTRTPAYDLDFPDAVVDDERHPFSARYVFIETGSVLIELIEPLSRSIYTEFLDNHGENIHHIGYYVDDFDRSLELAESVEGAAVVVRAPTPGQGRFAYIAGVTPGPLLEFIDADDAAANRG